MLWLKRLTASKKNLVGPDFEQAPWYELDLSGTKVKFRNPPQTAQYPNPPRPTTWDIYKDELYNLWGDGKGMTLFLVKNGWDFYGNIGQGALGGVDMQMILQRRTPQNREIDTLFNKKDFSYWVLDELESEWGELNNEIWKKRDDFVDKIDPEKHFWRYPKNEKDLKRIPYNGFEWIRYEIYKPKRKHERVWRLPVSDDHVLGVSFRPNAIRYDYFDPNHNLDEAVENTIKTFMSNLHITLSADAQQRYNTVKAEEKQAKAS